MKTFLVFFILSFLGFFLKPGEPISSIEVYLEQDGRNSPIAFQQTGDNGKVTFSNLSQGLYRIKVVLPQQSGKFMRGKNNISCPLLAGFNNDKQEYFLQEEEGFFTICYSNFRKVADNRITPVYNTEQENRNKMVEIGKFEIRGNSGSFTMEIRAQKPGTFEKLVQKASLDIGMVTLKKAV